MDAEFLKKLTVMLQQSRHHLGGNPDELLIYVVRILDPILMEKPRMWEKIVKAHKAKTSA